MGLDTPRIQDLTAEPLHDPAARAVQHQLVLGDELQGPPHKMRACFKPGTVLLRCWNPSRMHPSLEVVCEAHPGTDDGLVFLLLDEQGGKELLAPAARYQEAAVLLADRLKIRM